MDTDSRIDGNTGDVSNSQQLIASLDAMLAKHRASQNNLNKEFDDQIGLRETAATGVVSGGASNAEHSDYDRYSLW